MKFPSKRFVKLPLRFADVSLDERSADRRVCSAHLLYMKSVQPK